jgi:hypothetical protein
VLSVPGMGGLLPSGELFAIVLFSKVRISLKTAVMFRTLALRVKLVLLPFVGRRVFAEQEGRAWPKVSGRKWSSWSG